MVGVYWIQKQLQIIYFFRKGLLVFNYIFVDLMMKYEINYINYKYTFESTASICKLICTRITYIIINNSKKKSFSIKIKNIIMRIGNSIFAFNRG